ncbi:hypothetical protein [Sorangium sp. So ce1389]|uniref:hypothetical protein n=1 Tax=Sorangium sp. So ce1389 TaxID=3133336 RepID=UPI003F5EF070
MPRWKTLFCCCNPRKKATASLGLAPPIPNSDHLDAPLPALPEDRGVLTNATLMARARALKLTRTRPQIHGDDGYGLIGANERHGPSTIVGCASAWALANGTPVYAHCSDGGEKWTALRDAVARAGADPDQVTQIRVTRPTLSGGSDVTDDDLDEARKEVLALRRFFPNANITRWFVERATTTYFDQDGEPSPF